MIMKLYTRLLIILTILTTTVCLAKTSATPSAAEVLRKAVATMKNTPSVEASFSVSMGGRASSGEILISGDKFTLTTPELSTWFDGKTQWAYSPSAKEVNVSEPTPEELQQINPFAILSTMQNQFTPRRLKSDAGYDKIELIPKGKSEYAKIVAVFNSTTHLPKEIIITSTDRSVTTIKITGIKKGGKTTGKLFQFNLTRFPGVEIVDLR